MTVFAKQLGSMQAYWCNYADDCYLMYSYRSRVVKVKAGTAGNVILFGCDAFYSTTTGKQISRFFREVMNGMYPELESAAGRRKALKRGTTDNKYGVTVSVKRDYNMV